MTLVTPQQVTTMKYTRSDFPQGFLLGASAPAPMARGLDSYRIPVRWDDILPDGRTSDAKALDACARQIDQLLALGIRPCVTLENKTLPIPLLDLGGWRNRDVAARFADFAQIVVARIGDRAFSVAPQGNFPPDQNPATQPPDFHALARSVHHHLLAIGHAITSMRSYGRTNLGIDVNLTNPGFVSLLSAIFNKCYPDDLLRTIGPHLPEGWERDFDTIAVPVDWLGLTFQDEEPFDIAETLSCLARDYTGALPVYVTTRPDSAVKVNDHLDALRSASKKPVPVQGAFFMTRDENAMDALRTIATSYAHPVPWVRPEGALHAHWNLVADIGGTNTRLGVVTDGELTDLRKHATGTLADLHEALHSLRDEIGTDPRAVVAAGAGPVQNGVIRLTNANLDLSEDELARATGAQHTFVINDFTAAAWSVAEIAGDDVEVLQGETSPPMGTRLVVGPGTGLGVGALLYSEGHFHTVSGEGGHMGLSPRHLDEVDVFDAARRIAPECFFDDSLVLEAEMFLSGTGLPILYQAVGIAGGQANTAARSAKDILQDARDGSDPCAVKTARMFTEHLGAITGDLAVALVPNGGVFLVGGVAKKNRWLFGQDFMRAFNAGGRFDALRRGMNVYISEQDEFGIVGANNFCKNALAR